MKSEVPIAVVDAKYKMFEQALDELMNEPSRKKKPAGSDMYELIAGMLANSCHSGVLVYPASRCANESHTTPIRTWEIYAFGETIFIGAVGIDLSRLTSRKSMSEVIKEFGSRVESFISSQTPSGASVIPLGTVMPS